MKNTKKKSTSPKQAKKSAKPIRDLAPLEGRSRRVSGGRARLRTEK